ncbi:MAG: HAD hydrolase-like protein [Clostridia bacterium]
MKKIKAIFVDGDDTIKNFTLEDELILYEIQKDMKCTEGPRKVLVKLIEKVALYIRSFGLLKANMRTLDLRLAVHAIVLNKSIKKYKQLYYEYMKKIEIPFSNTINVINNLNSNGYEIFFVSNNLKSKSFAQNIGFKDSNICITKKKSNKYNSIATIMKEKNYRPDEVVMVGDSLSEDIYPANKLGVTTIWVNVNGRLKESFTKIIKPNYVIYDIIQILEILELLN